MGGKAKKPKEDPASIASRKRQTEQLLDLDDEQNVRVRRMYNASTGMRSFRGASDTRLPSGDSAASPDKGNNGMVQSNKVRSPGKLAGKFGPLKNKDTK